MRKMGRGWRKCKSFDFVQNIATIYVQNNFLSFLTMTTEMISLSEYRKNLSSLHLKSQKNQITYIVTVHGKPVWNITPIQKGDVGVTTKYSQAFIDELAEMEKDYKA
jgi:antitoxin (DNA-binding transcriptional repressor) of toxin-antitoxin stability system